MSEQTYGNEVITVEVMRRHIDEGDPSDTTQ